MPNRPTRSELARGARRSARVVARSLRELDREQLGALVAAAVLLIVLATPWYELSTTARGADRAHVRAHEALSGWDALSRGSLVCALVALATITLLATRTGSFIDGLGANARRAARRRSDGRLIAAAGTLGAVCVLWSIASHPAPHVAIAGASAGTQLRYGIVLGLLAAIALAAFGARIARLPEDVTPAGRARRDPPRRARRTHRGRPTPTATWRASRERPVSRAPR